MTVEMASHQPVHPIHEDVELSAEATGIVDKIELWMTEYSIATDGSMSETGQASMLKSCNPFLWRSKLNCATTLSLDSDHTLMVFEARAFVFWAGQESESYGFASGQYHHSGAGEVPKEKEPIPIRINSHDIQGYLDIAMIPDPDLLLPEPDPALEFRSRLHEVIAMYFQYDAIRKARGLFNFYYSPFKGEYKPENDCTWVLPDNISELLDTADVILFLHKAALQDCKEGAKISSEIDYDKTLVHESGHGLFGLRDEYQICDGSYFPSKPDQVCQRNIWRDMDFEDGEGKEACENDAPSGLEPLDCNRIIPPGNVSPWGNVWRIDPADFTGLNWADCKWNPDPKGSDLMGCIMGDLQHADPSDFGPACLRRIDFRYENCFDGVCIPDDCP